jgi:hypothetical protein
MNNLRLTMSFIGWCGIQLIEMIQDKHTSFIKSLRQETGFTIFLWFIITLLSTVLLFLVVAVNSGNLTVVSYVVGAWVFVSVSYLISCGVLSAFGVFMCERERLFETLKKPHGL